MYTIIRTKKNIPDKTRDYLDDLVYEIPLEQRKRLVKSKAYRERWLDSTMFWKMQFEIKTENRTRER